MLQGLHNTSAGVMWPLTVMKHQNFTNVAKTEKSGKDVKINIGKIAYKQFPVAAVFCY